MQTVFTSKPITCCCPEEGSNQGEVPVDVNAVLPDDVKHAFFQHEEEPAGEDTDLFAPQGMKEARELWPPSLPSTLLTSKPRGALWKPAPNNSEEGDLDPAQITALEPEPETSTGKDDPEAALPWIDDQGGSLEAVGASIFHPKMRASRLSLDSDSCFDVGKKSSLDFDTGTLPELESSVRDTCVIVIGASKQAFELARRRMKAHGRLALLWTDVPPSGTFDGSEFTWLPPTGDQRFFQAGFQRLVRSIQCKPKDTGVREAQWQFGAFKARRFSKAGPDVVTLGPGERYEIAKTSSPDTLGGIRVLKGEETIWALTGAVVLAGSGDPEEDLDTISMAVGNKCAQPVPLPTPGRFFICMVIQFAVLFLQTLAPTLQSPLKEVPTFWNALFYAVGALFFAYSVIDQWLGPSLCGVPCTSKTLKIASCTVQCVVASVLYCVPVYESRYPVEFLISCVNTSVLIIACSLLHCALVREPPRYWKWWAFQCFGPLWLGFAGFYSICVIYTYIGAGLGAPIAAAVFLPISLTLLESSTVFMTCQFFRLYSYHTNALGEQTIGIPMAIGMFHGFAEGARLSALLLGAVRTGSYTWVLSAFLGLFLNLLSRFGWSRFYCMCVLHAISPRLRNLIIPSMCSRVHAESKFLLGYVRFLTPVVMAIVRSSQGMSPFSGLSGLFVVIVACVLEVVEDAIVRHELLPYAKPMLKFTDLLGVYKSYGRFNPLQAFLISENHARQTRPMMLYGMRPLSFGLTMCLVIPPCIFPIYLFHAYLGRGYISGFCEDPIENPLTLGLLLQEWPPSC